MVKANDLPRLDRASVGIKVPTACAFFLPFALARFEHEKPCTEVSQLNTNRPGFQLYHSKYNGMLEYHTGRE
jgi:hypothetical protein